MTERLEVLLKEYEIISKTISEFSNRQYEVLSRSIIVISGLLLYGVKAEMEVILIPAPIALIALFNHLLYKIERNNYSQNYKSNIEAQINSLITSAGAKQDNIFFSKVEAKKLGFSNWLYVLNDTFK